MSSRHQLILISSNNVIVTKQNTTCSDDPNHVSNVCQIKSKCGFIGLRAGNEIECDWSLIGSLKNKT